MRPTKDQRGFTLIELLIVMTIISILGMVSVPMVTANTQEARQAEAETLLGTMRNVARIEYTRRGSAPKKFTDCGIRGKERKGEYFKVQNKIAGSNIRDARIRAISLDGNKVRGDMHFTWSSGVADIVWR